MRPEELDLLINYGEGDLVDLKGELNLSGNWHRAEFVKDMLALVNAHGDGNRYLIIGVTNTGDRVGMGGRIPDDAALQQLVAAHVEPPIAFLFRTINLAGVDFGVIEIQHSDERFHVSKAEIRENDKLHLKRGEIYIRRGSGKVPITAWDFRLLRKEWLARHASQPQPSLRVCFLDGQQETGVHADWSDYNAPESRLAVLLASNPMEKRYPPGTAKIGLQIVNDGTLEAHNITVFISVPEGCSVPEYHPDAGKIISTAVRAQKRWHTSHDHEDNQICIQGDRLTHRLVFDEDDVRIVFPSPNTDYELNWEAHAGNMPQRASGVLRVHVN